MFNKGYFYYRKLVLLNWYQNFDRIQEKKSIDSALRNTNVRNP